jgi:hypothetical protein
MKRSDPRRGVILVTVLWSIALLSALAMAASVTFRGFAGVMAVERDRVQGDALLSAGLETAAGIIDTLGDAPLLDIEAKVNLATGSVRSRPAMGVAASTLEKRPPSFSLRCCAPSVPRRPRRMMSRSESLNDVIPAMRLVRPLRFVRPMAPPGRRERGSHFPTCGSSSSFPECSRTGWLQLRRLRLYSAVKP